MHTLLVRRFLHQSTLLALMLAGAACSRIEQAVPRVPITTITGQAMGAAQFQGRVTLVNFWATTCDICVAEMPMLSDTWRQFSPRGFDLVAVAMPYDRPDFVLDYANSRKLPFKVALDPQGEVSRAWPDVQATPTSFLVNRQGIIVKRYLGRPDAAQLRADIEQWLAQG
jgi:peroxiredoxin